MLVYNHCASIQTANYFLSNTALELYENLNAIRKNNSTNCIDHSPKANEMMTSDYNRTEEWCILWFGCKLCMCVCVHCKTLYLSWSICLLPCIKIIVNITGYKLYFIQRILHGWSKLIYYHMVSWGVNHVIQELEIIVTLLFLLLVLLYGAHFSTFPKTKKFLQVCHFKKFSFTNHNHHLKANNI